jgi:ferredoxin
MRAMVDEDLCSGCGLCAETCPEVFRMSGNLAEAWADPVPEDVEESCRDAATSCPEEAISIEA